MTNSPNPSTAIHHIAAVPLFYWRGARPYPLTLTADDTGTAEMLILSREGDLCLLPTRWEQNLPTDRLPTTTAFYADALDQEAFRLTLHDLQSDGWQVDGRVHLQFTGRETQPDFWHHTQASLWTTPPQ